MMLIYKALNYYQNYKKAIHDTIISMIPQIIGVFTGFFTSVLLARGLGKEKLGEYALIMSFYGIVTVFFDLGVGQTAIRFASKSASSGDYDAQAAVLRWAFRIRVFLVAVISFFAVLSAPFVSEKVWNAGHLSSLMRVSLVIGALGALAAVPNVYFQSVKKFKMNTLVSAGQTVILFLGILFLEITHAWKLEWVILASIVSTLIGVAVFMFLVPGNMIFDRKEFQTILKNKMKGFWNLRIKNQCFDYHSKEVKDFAFFIMISSIVVTLVTRADVWLMGMFIDKAEIGVYTAATKVTIPLTVVLGAVNTALWPRASALKTIPEIKNMMRQTMRVNLLLFFGGLIYSFIAPLFIPFVFGEAYRGGIFLAQLLCFRYALALLVSSIGVIGYSLGMVKENWWINIIQLGIVLFINTLLLTKLGPLASAYSLILSEFIGNAIAVFLIILKIQRRI